MRDSKANEVTDWEIEGTRAREGWDGVGSGGMARVRVGVVGVGWGMGVGRERERERTYAARSKR